MRPQLRRMVSGGIAIVLGVAFVTATLILASTLKASIASSVSAGIGDASVVVSSDERSVTDDDVQRLSQIPGVDSVETTLSSITRIDVGERNAVTEIFMTPSEPGATEVVDGRLPNKPNEIAISEAARSSWDLNTGDSISILPITSIDAHQQVLVVGVVKLGVDLTPMTNQAAILAGLDDVRAWGAETGFSSASVISARNGDELREDVAAHLDAGLNIRTADEEIHHRISAWSGGADALQGVLLGFGTVAFFVAALVIANTFSILVAQRARHYALLRCIGATKGQVFSLVLRDAIILAILAGAIGVAVGIGFAALLAPFLGSILPVASTGISLSWVSIVAPLFLAVVVTVASAIIPARQATKVLPIEALRPNEAKVSERRGSRVRGVLATLVLIASGVGLYLAATQQNIVLGLLAGIFNFTSVLALGSWLVPGFAGLLRLPMRSAGVPGELAISNARRNPSRSAATAGALLIASTLISMLMVGASTGERTVNAAVDQQFPADVEVMGQGSLTDETMTALENVENVTGITEFWMGGVWPEDASLPGTIVGLYPDARSVLRDPNMVDGLDDDTIIVPLESYLDGEKITDGQTITLAGSSGTREMRAVVRSVGTPIMLADVMREISPEAQRNAWLKIADDADALTVIDEVNKALADSPGVTAMGAASMREQTQKAIDAVLLVTIGLLGISIIISFVGVGNTLGLGVHERTQELGLLRALGLTKPQVRSMIGIEGLAMGLYAIVAGTVLGIGYGIAGVGSLLATEAELLVWIPWVRLALVAVFILVASWLASIIPASRAAAVSPVRALAAD